ncbi:HPr kinase/phosphorylase [Pseudophaeobacter leonis]|uniref:HPr kinase/phosphorylase n=1 Tax=Pseudophaeobacter leonis TaxID=1144477 RepID=UPI0009F6963D|nr:HPr kinase/phosphatase C-terminal domain-containing protein [Pseudophaeobacter leonis]
MSSAPIEAGLTLHASCVALGGRGVLIRGRSGSGKSALALQMMGYGADLVADDRVQIRREADQVKAAAPAGLSGLIEARYMGILNAETSGVATICAIVDLDHLETERLPVPRYERLLDQRIVVFRRVEGAYFAAALIQYLKAGAIDPDAHP